jgi:hypothetical protein
VCFKQFEKIHEKKKNKSNISLESWTYNLIAMARAFNNNKYPQCCLSTHANIIRNNASQIALTIIQVCLEGIQLAKAFVWQL